MSRAGACFHAALAELDTLNAPGAIRIVTQTRALRAAEVKGAPASAAPTFSCYDVTARTSA
jgi:hypothetical protein